jgi:hypothetical protein
VQTWEIFYSFLSELEFIRGLTWSSEGVPLCGLNPFNKELKELEEKYGAKRMTSF